MSQHLSASRPDRVLSWRQVKRGIIALRRRARSGALKADADARVQDAALSRLEPMFKLPNRFSSSN
jgi:hypothetical protein